MKEIAKQFKYSAGQCARLCLVITVAWGVMVTLNQIWLASEDGQAYVTAQKKISEAEVRQETQD